MREKFEIIISGTTEDFIIIEQILNIINEDFINKYIGQRGKEIYWEIFDKVKKITDNK